MITVTNPEAIAAKHGNPEGIKTENGVLIAWPNSIPYPTQGDIDLWEAEYSLSTAVANKNEEINRIRDEKKSLSISSEGYEVDAGDFEAGEMAATLFMGRGVSITLVSLTSVGSMASGATQKNHNLVSGQTISVIGADQVEYNTTANITVTGKKTFDYNITGTPPSPATGDVSFSVGSFQHIPTTNETNVMIDAIIYAQIAADLKGYVDACQINARELKNQVLAAPDIASIDAIDINTGWPDTGL